MNTHAPHLYEYIYAMKFVLLTRKVDTRLPGKGNSNSHGARPVHLNYLDLDQEVINKELSLCTRVARGSDDNADHGLAEHRRPRYQRLLIRKCIFKCDLNSDSNFHSNVI